MAKQLPYFKFFCSEWSDGDITLEDMKTQGVFINICSYYWSQECEISYEKLLKRFKNYQKQIENLKKEKIIFSENGKLLIKFLDKQWKEREAIKQRNHKNGSGGGRPKKTQSVNFGKPNDNPSETNKEKIREEEKRKDKSKPKKDPRITEVIDYLNLKTNSNFRVATGLDTRLSEGYTVDDAKKVIDIKCAEWEGTDQEKFLRPQTLFSGKFDAYLNQKEPVQRQHQEEEIKLYPI
tara:strand:+ start:791 stop:1498 length:708 start_codon:yes stop_codon:yes gene_type:complete